MLQLTPTGFQCDRIPPGTASIDVLFDEDRVWSIDLAGRKDDKTPLLQEWPEALRPHLSGRTRLSITDSTSGAEIATSEVEFDSGTHRTRVANGEGVSLAINKWGRLGIALDSLGEATQQLIIERASHIVEHLLELGLRPFVVGGTLLGGVRSGQLLPHDDDADIAYLSTHTKPVDVAVEAFSVGRELEALGYEIKRHSATHMQLLFRDDNDTVLYYIDVFAAFFTPDGHINQPFHVRGLMREEQMLPFGQVTIGDATFAAPADTDRWLTINYDERWRQPIPGFQLVTPEATRRRFENWFGWFNFQGDFWDGYYSGQSSGDDTWRTGRAWLLAQNAELRSTALIDLGCGSGSLTHSLARQRPQRHTLGLDFCGAALAHASTASTSSAVFGPLNLNRLSSLSFARQHGIAAAFDVVSNHVLEQLHRHGREHVWRIIRMALRSGGSAYFTCNTRPAVGVTPEDPTTWHLDRQQLQNEAARFGLELTYTALAGTQHDRDRHPVGVRVSIAPDPHRITSNRENTMQLARMATGVRTRARRLLGRDGERIRSTAELERALRIERERVDSLEAEIDELRRDGLRVAELIDLAEQAFTPHAPEDDRNGPH